MAFRRPRLGSPPSLETDPGPRRGFLAAAVALIAGGTLLGRAPRARAATQASDPFIGEIMLWAGNFAPNGWAFCDGSLQSIANNTALFSLLGTTYGGDGVSTFALPDLRGRTPIDAGTALTGTPYVLGQLAGAETVALTPGNLPFHAHPAYADAAAGSSDSPGGLDPARDAAGMTHYGTGTGAPLAPGHLAPAGGGAGHPNLAPFVTLTYCIALYGIYPSRS